MPRGMASTAGGQWRHLLSWGQAAGGAGWGAFLLAMWGMGTGFTRSGETLLADDTASRDQLCDHAEPVCPSPQQPDAQQVTFPGNLDAWVAWVVV